MLYTGACDTCYMQVVYRLYAVGCDTCYMQ